MKRKVLFTLLLCMAFVKPATADLYTVDGAVSYAGSIPSDLTLNTYESDETIFLFDEQRNIALSSDVWADIKSYGTYETSDDLTGAGGYIPATTLVNSYLFHVDPVSEPTSPLVVYEGSATFTNPILGVIVETASLNDSDDEPGMSPDTTYYTGANRGLEWTNQDEITWLSVSDKTLTLHLEAGNVLDHVRVIEAVPVPGAVLLGMLGLSVAGVKLRKYA